MTAPSPRPRALSLGALLAGVVLLGVYIRLGAFIGFHATYGPHGRWTGELGFLSVAPTELEMWIAHLAIALPGVLLVAWGLAPSLGPALARLAANVDAATPRAWRIAAAAYVLLLVAWAIIGRHVFLLDRSITDDENAVKFGAQIFASGHVSVPALPSGAFTQLFTYERGGVVASVDFPGGLLFGAVSLVTGLGSVLYALATGITGVAVAYAAGVWLGPRARVLSAAVWLVSPMVASLSLTTHAHVVSRMFVALALAFAARLDTAAVARRSDALWLGACAGLAFLCRPLESACLLAPIAAFAAWRARATAAWIAAGALPALGVFAWYNAALTGVWYLPARFDTGATSMTPVDRHGALDRLGFNVGWNVLMLAVFFLLVPAIAAVAGGIDRKRPLALALAAGVGIDLALGLAHDNTGIHSVGPIHYSEAAVPLALLAVLGMMRGFDWLRARHVARAPAAALLAGYLALGCGIFDASNLLSLRGQAEPQRLIADTIAAAGVHRAIVIAPTYAVFVYGHPEFATSGTWVLEYPHPDPFMRDDVVFAHEGTDPAMLHSHYPDRALYELTYVEHPPYLNLVELVPK